MDYTTIRVSKTNKTKFKDYCEIYGKYGDTDDILFGKLVDLVYRYKDMYGDL